MTSIFRARSATASSASSFAFSDASSSRATTPTPDSPAQYIDFQVVYSPGSQEGYGSEALPSTHVSLDLTDLERELKSMRNIDEIVVPPMEEGEKIVALCRYPLGNPLKKPTRYALPVDASAGITRGQLVKAAVQLYNEVFEVEKLKKQSKRRNSDMDRWGYELDDLLLKAVEWYPDTRELWLDVVA